MKVDSRIPHLRQNGMLLDYHGAPGIIVLEGKRKLHGGIEFVSPLGTCIPAP